MDYEEAKLEREKAQRKVIAKWIIAGSLSLVMFVTSLMAGIPVYNVWQKGLSGKAALKQAEWDRQIAVKEAEAKTQAAKFLAKAEVERAKGVSEANKIIGASLKGNESYLRYLWIQGLHDGSSEVIYIPTEANLPILEATRKIQNNKERK